MAEQGEPYVLVDATGTVFGLYVIEQIDETGSIFGIDSKPRKIDFTVNLTRVDDNRIDQVGLITDPAKVLA
jgi:phage protein U